MISQILTMFFLTVLQNASFTLVSRARNSKSLTFHTIASILSNGIYLLVIRHVVSNLNNWVLMVTYVVGAVVGGLIMHYISMKYLEKIENWGSLLRFSRWEKMVGKDVVGFKFEDEDIIWFTEQMERYIGVMGTVGKYDKKNHLFEIFYPNGVTFTYPAKGVKDNLYIRR